MDMILENVISGTLVAVIGIAIEYFRRGYKRGFKDLDDKFSKAFDDVEAKLNDIKIDTLRNRILTLLYDDPHSHLEILDLFDQYEKLGGNGATKERIIEWKKAEGLD